MALLIKAMKTKKPRAVDRMTVDFLLIWKAGLA